MHEFMSAKQTAQLLGVSIHTIYRMIARGEIKTFRKSGNYRIPKAQFKEKKK